MNQKVESANLGQNLVSARVPRVLCNSTVPRSANIAVSWLVVSGHGFQNSSPIDC